MIKNYVTTVFRQVLKYKGFSIINVLGLSLGMACFVFIAFYIQDESSFDQFHTKVERLYRVNKVVTPQEGGTEFHALTAGLLGPALEESFPEVDEAVRVLPWFNDILFVNEDRSFVTENVLLADANFFSVFSFDLIAGDPNQVLRAPLSIVLTESTARQLFADVDPVGMTVRGLNNLDYTVTGVAEDPSDHSHLDFQAIISWSSSEPGALGFSWMNRWITQAPFTYVLLSAAARADALEAKFPDFYTENDPERASRYQLYMQPLGDIYLGSANLLYTGSQKTGNIQYVRALGLVAVLILLIACINFINLTTARATSRAREVGVRKSLGATRFQLGWQFMGESFLYAFLSLIAATVLLQIAFPGFLELTGKSLRPDSWLDPSTAGILLGIVLFTGLVSGVWPALTMSRFRPANALRGQPRTRKGVISRNMLVGTQFAISTMLVVGTLIVLGQMGFMSQKDLGFEGDQIIILNTDDTAIQQQFGVFREEVLSHPAIVEAAGSSSVPGTSTMTFSLNAEGKTEEENWIANVVRLDDFDLQFTFQFEIAEGRFFDTGLATDKTNAIVINEALASSLGWTDPIGKSLDIDGETEGSFVIGVVKNFHFKSLRTAIEPLAFYYAPRGSMLSVRFQPSNVAGALEHLEASWTKFDSVYPFAYSFLDERFAAFYSSERTLMQLLTIFSSIAIIIACLGLFGLASFLTEQRTKETGIRKVLGASLTQIVIVFIRDFSRLLVAAFVVAMPAAYFLAESWLGDFAYRMTTGVEIFLMAGGIVGAIALLSVTYQPIRAALADPVEALRYE